MFSDLFDLDLIDKFFSLDVDTHCCLEVIDELLPAQKECLKEYQSQNKLLIHSIEKEDWDLISKKRYSNNISYNDKVALYLSEKLDCLLLSSDAVVRQTAKKKSVDYHGILWVFDQLIENGKINATEAIEKLSQLPTSIKLYKQNIQLISQIEARICRWKASGNPALFS